MGSARADGHSDRVGVSRRRVLQLLAGLAALPPGLALARRVGPAVPAVSARSYRSEVLRALVATVVPGTPEAPGAAEAGLEEVLIDVLDLLEPDASLTAAMYLDEFSIDVSGGAAEFAQLPPAARDAALARICAHEDETVRSIGLFLVAGTLVLFYSEVGEGLIRERTRSGALPEGARSPWQHAGYPGPHGCAALAACKRWVERAG